MNFKHIVEVFKSASRKHVYPPLGRWNHGNHSHTILKINYANEDHCGSCSEYAITKQETYKQSVQSDELDETYKYMIGGEALPDYIQSK